MSENLDETAKALTAAEARIAALEKQVAGLEKREAGLKNLEAKVDAWRDALQTNEEKAISATGALFDDANGWAQHFSTVRLTLTTFLIAICLGIMQFQWEEPSWIGIASTITIWFLALILFFYYTYYEYRKIGQLNRNKTLLLKLTGSTAEPDERTMSSDVPSGALILFSIAFMIACCFWISRIKDDSEPRQGDEESATEPEVVMSRDNRLPESFPPENGQAAFAGFIDMSAIDAHGTPL